jgi:hypothetical protein
LSECDIENLTEFVQLAETEFLLDFERSILGKSSFRTRAGNECEYPYEHRFAEYEYEKWCDQAVISLIALESGRISAGEGCITVST